MAQEIGALRASASLDAAAFETGAKAARSALQSIGVSFDKVSRDAVRDAANMAQAWGSAAASGESAAQKQIAAMTGLDRANRAASASAKAWVSQLNRQARSFDQLRASVDPVFAASKRYEAAQEQVNQAVQSGVISQQEASHVLSLVEKQYLGTGKAAAGYGAQAKVATHHTANLAFQFNDIGMMMAAGQNPFMLAMQQGTQVSQVLNQMGGGVKSVRAVGAAILQVINPTTLLTIGLIAGAAAFGQWAAGAIGARRDAQALDDTISDLEATIDEYRSAALSGADATKYIADNFGIVNSETILLAEKMQNLRIREVMLGAAEATALLADTFSGRFGSELARIEKLIPPDWMDDQAVSAKRLASALEAVRQATSIDDQLAAVIGLRENFEAITGGLGRMTEEQRNFYREILETEASLSRAANLTYDAEAASEAWAGAMSGVRVEVNAILSLLESIGGGALSNAAKQAEINALRAGKSIREASFEAVRLKKTVEFDAEEAGASNIFERFAVDVKRFQFEHGLALDAVLDKEREAARERERLANKADTGSASKSAIAALQAELASRAALLGMTKKQRREYEALAGVYKRLGKEADKMSGEQIEAMAMQLIAIEDAETAMQRVVDLQGQWSQQITRTAFEGGSLGDTISGMLKDIGYQFAHAKVVLPVVASVTSVLGLDQILLGSSGGLAGVGGSAPDGFLGGLLGGLGGSGGFLGGIGSGLAGVFSGGGLSSSFANLGGLVSGSIGGLGAIGAAIPAIGLVALAFSALIGKTKVLNSGLRITVDEYDALIQSFVKTKTTRLFGLISSKKTKVGALDDETVGPILSALSDIQMGVVDMADVLGFGADAFAGFATTLDVSLKGLDDDEKAEAVAKALGEIGDEMALMLPGLEGLIEEGETATQTLTRLTTTLTAVQSVSDTLGHVFDLVGISGASAASDLVAAFGGLDAYNTATTTYFQSFYTEAERIETMTRQATDALTDMNLAMPQSRAEYRAMIEAIDLTTDSGREMYAALVGMASTFDQILPSVTQFTEVIAGLVGSSSSLVQQMISETNSLISASDRAAQAWYAAADNLRDLIMTLINARGSTLTPAQQVSANRNLTQSLYQAALGGDVDAARSFGGAAQDYLDAVRNTAGSYADYKRAEGQIRAQAKFLTGISELEGASQDAIVTLAEQQLGVLNNLNDYLQSVEEIDPDDLEGFVQSLESLQVAIKEAEMFSYDFLKERLQVTVDLIPTADVPEDVRDLMAAATTGIQSTIDFAVHADDLTPDLRWLAVSQASRHLTTIDFALGDELEEDTARLALMSSGSITRTVNAVINNDLSQDEMRLALAGNSELARVVNVALSSDAEQEAIHLALQNAGTYAVSVRAALDASDQVRQIVFTDGSSYAAMIEAAFSNKLTDDQRRVLLEQQGEYAVNVLATLSQDIPAPIQSLLLDANTAAIRAITISFVFGDDLTQEERWTLMHDGREILQTLNLAVNPMSVTSLDVLLLDQLAVGSGAVTRAVIAEMWGMSKIGRNGQGYLGQLEAGNGAVTRAVRGQMWLDKIGPRGVDYLGQLYLGDGPTTRAIRGGMWLDHIGQRGNAYFAQLTAGGGSVTRAIKGATWLDKIGGAGKSYLGQLFTGDGSVLRAVKGATWLDKIGAKGSNYLAQLIEGNGSVIRAVKGETWLDKIGAFGKSYLSQLFVGSGSITRAIKGAVDVGGLSGLGSTFLAQLAAKTSTVQKIIEGIVDISGLSKKEQTLLSMVTGAVAGTVMLGGAVSFDPSKDFTNWFGDVLDDGITSPLSDLTTELTGSLSELVQAVQDHESALASIQDSTKQAQIDSIIAGLQTNNRGMSFANDGQILALANLMGIDTQNRDIGNVMWDVAQRSQFDALERFYYDPTGVAAQRFMDGLAPDSGSQYTRSDFKVVVNPDKPWLRDVTGPLGKTFHQVGINRMRELIDGVVLGTIPAFASGGVHGGGWAMVGERGPELAYMPPARVYSAPQTRDMLSSGELRELLTEIRLMRQEQRQLGLRSDRHQKKTADILDKWDVIGLPQEQT
ncbi:phage tail length tape measure family protein [Thiosulfatihalobacter marinus]|uniref:phage tail length tape measure family protein n=1 Tax=Thiosulfatihalobacter marinus TaxID=2792481 RepID=UPI0018D7440C|nr:phage tail length tape measure family protein [Thiosulfatihalobacter marinus]